MKAKSIGAAVAVALALPLPAAAADSVLYVSPSGRDGATGTISDPTTLTSAITRIAAGGTI